MMTATLVDWRRLYHHALKSAQDALGHTPRVACGFTNNVDIVVQVEPGMLSPFRTMDPRLLTGDLPPGISTPVDLGNALLHYIRRGVGGEMQVMNPPMVDWMRGHFDGPTQIGGTGARAANALAILGFDSLMHVTGLSALEAELHAQTGKLTVASGDQLLPPTKAARPGDLPMFHHIFEYQAGVPLDFGSAVVSPSQANRIITYYDPLNLTVLMDPTYLAAIDNPDNHVKGVLISGFNQMERTEYAAERVTSLLEHIQQWRTRPIFLHVELASIVDPDIAVSILGVLAHHVDSIGLNIDEVPILAEAVNRPPPQTITQCLDVLAAFKNQAKLHRINLHTQLYCLSLTDGDPEEELRALLFASLVAGARAANGSYPSMGVLEAVLEKYPVRQNSHLDEEVLASNYHMTDGIGHSTVGAIVYVPTLSVEHPVTTVGLGDTYTGALLSMLEPY